MPQYVSSEQGQCHPSMHAQSLKQSCLKISHHLEKSTINERSVSQCRISSRVTVSPIKTLSEMAMPQCKVIPQFLIHHNPREKRPDYVSMQDIIPKENAINEWGMPQCR